MGKKNRYKELKKVANSLPACHRKGERIDHSATMRAIYQKLGSIGVGQYIKEIRKIESDAARP